MMDRNEGGGAPTRLEGEAWLAVLVLVGHIVVLAAGVTWAMGGF